MTRTIKVADAPTWIGLAAAVQVAQLRRTVTKNGKKSVEVVYLITSAALHDAPPAILASWVKGHWCIESALHWVRDVTYDEDRSQVRTRNSPRHGLAAKHHHRDPQARRMGQHRCRTTPSRP